MMMTKFKRTETNPADSASRILLESATKDRETLIVLYELPGGGPSYVTWAARRDSPEDTYWGHYFATLQEAQDDFEKRLGMDWNFARG
ncbi:hypothetical protein LCGC14_2464320 [marine sediment metagenome]|uniref:Uncharacterized protein n=1 Tax=marine sediment metagenome TaxID=412755 RepID=A0A0F9C016_9ZZZZ